MYVYFVSMSSSSFFGQKSQQWWLRWSCKRCEGAADSKSAETRGKILMAAFDEIYHCGFQAASLSNILKKTTITKGALYHHFKNKMDLGYAVVDEVIFESIKAVWIDPLEDTDDPIPVLQQILLETGEMVSDADVRLGCPLHNLSQEMSAIDEGFRHRITHVYDEWFQALESAAIRGQKAGNVRQESDPKQLSVLFIATLQGCLAVAKTTQSIELLMDCGQGLVEQLELAKPVDTTIKNERKKND